jgi:predicted PurR-regulated permease PerM
MNSKKPYLSSFTFWMMILLALLISWQLIPLMDVLLGTLILYVLLKPAYSLFTTKLHVKGWLASLVLILVTLALVLIPAYYTVLVFYQKLSIYMSQDEINKITASLDAISEKYLRFTIFTPENIKSLEIHIAGLFTNIVSMSFAMLGNIALLCFFLFFMLLYTGRIEQLIHSYLPIEQEITEKLGNEMETQVFSNVLGAPVLALLQGLVATGGYALAGLPDPFFYGIATGMMSFLPTVGSALIWIPAGLWLISEQHLYKGIGLLAFGLIVISTVDNVFRFVMQKRIADVHPIVTVLGLIIGIKSFGLAGIIFGPLLLSFFLILLRWYAGVIKQSVPK